MCIFYMKVNEGWNVRIILIYRFYSYILSILNERNNICKKIEFYWFYKSF